MSVFIDDHKARFGVEPICRALQIAPSTYYAVKTRQREPSARAQRDAELVVEIRRVYEQSKGLYGARKVWWQLRLDGIEVARCTVERLMRQAGLEGVRRGRRRRTTICDEQASRPADLVERDFSADAPNRLWVADFTYVMTWSGVVYVAFVIDAFSRRIVGWKADTTMKTSLVLDTLEMALWSRQRAGIPLAEDLIHHNDAGSQGGFTRSSQHLDVRSCDEQAGWVDDDVDGASGDEVAGASALSTRDRAAVLAPDRRGSEQRGRGACGRGLLGGWQPMVQRTWRDGHAAARSRDVPVFVLCRA